MSTSNAVDVYLDKLGKHLTGSRQQKKNALAECKRMLLEVPGSEAMTIDQLESIVGTPADVLENLAPNLSVELAHEASHKERFRRILLGVCILFGIVILVLGTIFVIDTYGANHGYYNDSPAMEGIFQSSQDAVDIY